MPMICIDTVSAPGRSCAPTWSLSCTSCVPSRPDQLRSLLGAAPCGDPLRAPCAGPQHGSCSSHPGVRGAGCFSVYPAASRQLTRRAAVASFRSGGEIIALHRCRDCTALLHEAGSSAHHPHLSHLRAAGARLSIAGNALCMCRQASGGSVCGGSSPRHIQLLQEVRHLPNTRPAEPASKAATSEAPLRA